MHNIITIPTIITLLRLATVPFLVHSLLIHNWLLGFTLFLIAAITDVLDGALARRLKQETFFGSFVDSIADKVLLLSVYITLMVVIGIPTWFVLFISINELVLVGASFYGLLYTGTMIVGPTQLGRMTAFAQILFLAWAILIQGFGTISPVLLSLFLFLIMCARICALYQYVLILWRRYE